MEFNIKNVSPIAWILIVIGITFMASMLYFQPDFNNIPKLVYAIGGLIGAWIIYELLKMTGILGKIFNKEK